MAITIDILPKLITIIAFLRELDKNMADDIDIANDLRDLELASALNRMRQQSNVKVEGSATCVECGDAMPEARKNLGFKLCVACAQESERRKQQFAV
jgi:RNA polymerase-binding transcription factor DksA